MQRRILGLVYGRLTGGDMGTRWASTVAISLLVVATAIAGCAKRPATTAASAPAPTGTSMATGAGPSGTGVGLGAGGAAPGAGPSPREFAAVAALRDIFFDFDKYDIRPNDARTLDANATWLKSNPDHLVLIEGHCDERGTNEYNLALGERRAKSAMNYLVSQGVQASRITIISYGEERPVCTEHTEQCWAK